MGHVVGLVALIALADSLNPSTIAPAALLAAGRTPLRAVGGFVVGVTAVNVAVGFFVVLGPGQAVVTLAPHPDERARHLLELGVGAALLAAAILLWFARHRVSRAIADNEARVDRSSFLVGSTIMAVEIPTAFPYFAALAVILGSGKGLPVQMALTLFFDLLFVLPLLFILLLRLLMGARGAAVLTELRAGLVTRLASVLPIAVLAAGLVLLGIGVKGST